uniref:phosphatidate cytidylyltransferase n=1 Tax=Rhodosorus marinus TaxID=101924 RepID=A0A7S3AA50_9RHOD|mmetsp:Transcript_879/g.2247  ORF Transcript_879/g.2247 Transcript_879/m.2247 type:complete len:423 (+) Transcript_879:72-1340(+)
MEGSVSARKRVVKAGVTTDKANKTPEDVAKVPGVKKKKTWADFSTRLLAAVVMIGTVIATVWTGHIAVSTLIVFMECIVYSEVVNLGYLEAQERGMPWFKRITWGFFASTQYFVYGKSVLGHFEAQDRKFMENALLQFLLRHHTFVSFAVYGGFFVAFVLSLQPKLASYQFGIYARSHIAIFVVITCANFMILNVKMGMIWFLLPVVCVAMNDSFSYIFGRMFGKTPLTALSPKKTWEGLIYGGITTLISGFFVSRLLSRWEFMTCPKPEFTDCNILCRVHCTPSTVFLPSIFGLPKVFGGVTFSLASIQLHGVVIALFTSVLAPFGGFFASGAKRAFKVKDFGSIIPGHGGITDRVDCHLVMAVFTYVYVINFVRDRAPDVEKLLIMVSGVDRRTIGDPQCSLLTSNVRYVIQLALHRSRS